MRSRRPWWRARARKFFRWAMPCSARLWREESALRLRSCTSSYPSGAFFLSGEDFDPWAGSQDSEQPQRHCFSDHALFAPAPPACTCRSWSCSPSTAAPTTRSRSRPGLATTPAPRSDRTSRSHPPLPALRRTRGAERPAAGLPVLTEAALTHPGTAQRHGAGTTFGPTERRPQALKSQSCRSGHTHTCSSCPRAERDQTMPWQSKRPRAHCAPLRSCGYRTPRRP